MERVVARQPPLDPRPEVEESEHEKREQGATPERVRDDGVLADGEIPARHEPQAADQPAEIPVGLRAVRRRVGVVRAPEPDRVDLNQASEQEDHAGRAEHQPHRPGRLSRERGDAHDGVLALRALAPELRVVAQRYEQQVHRQQGADQDREEQDVRDVHAGPERLLPGKRSVEEPRHHVRADERQRQPDRVADREPHAGEQVVDQRVAEVCLQQRQHQHRHADQVRQLPRLPERAGEEDPEQVEDDRRDEDVRGPVVRLADQQSRLAGRREVEDRAVRLGHVLPPEGRVRPVVDDLRRRVDEEERQVDAGRDEHDEGVERNLAEQERPVVGEEVAKRLAQERRRARALVDEADDAADHGSGFQMRTPHQDGPIWSSKLPLARRRPCPSTRIGSIGSRRPAGPNRTLPPSAGSNVE